MLDNLWRNLITQTQQFLDKERQLIQQKETDCQASSKTMLSNTLTEIHVQDLDMYIILPEQPMQPLNALICTVLSPSSFWLWALHACCSRKKLWEFFWGKAAQAY